MSDDGKIPITYLKSGRKYLLETIKNYVKQKIFENLLPSAMDFMVQEQIKLMYLPKINI